jgi:hypothetical protein
MFIFVRERGHSRIFRFVSKSDFVVVNTSMVGVVAVSCVKLAVLIRTYYMTNTIPLKQ